MKTDDFFKDFDRAERQIMRIAIAGYCLTFLFYGVAMALMIAGIYWLINNV